MQSFSIAQSDARPFWILLPVMLIMLGGLVLLLVSLSGSRLARFEVSPQGLALRGDLWGRTIARADLQLDSARRAYPDREEQLRPARRTLGTAMPGYQGGWFRLRSGEKALLYLTDRSRAVYIPTRLGYALLLSPADPDAFLAALRKR